MKAFAFGTVLAVNAVVGENWRDLAWAVAAAALAAVLDWLLKRRKTP